MRWNQQAAVVRPSVSVSVTVQLVRVHKERQRPVEGIGWIPELAIFAVYK
jgi:hypothetical protein